MNFNWQLWIEKFVENPGYNDTGAEISEATNPAYSIIGAHKLTLVESGIRQCVYVDVLDTDNHRQQGIEIEYNNGVSEPMKIMINNPPGEIACFHFPSGDEDLNIWHREGEGLIGLKYTHSYLIVFQEIMRDKPQPRVARLDSIQVVASKEWIKALSLLEPDKQGNVTFTIGVK